MAICSAPDVRHTVLTRMNQLDTLKLAEQGRKAWNTWAQARLDERAALEADGSWVVERSEWN